MFQVITGDDWKRELNRARATPNAISEQIKLMEQSFKTKIQEASERQESQEFIIQMNRVQREVNQTAHEKGWYHSPLEQLLGRQALEILNGEDSVKAVWNEFKALDDAKRIAMISSEIMEALDGVRNGNPPSDKIGNKGFSQVEEEFADTIIRILDMSQERGWRIAEAIEAKRAYNNGREFRHGGKAI